MFVEAFIAHGAVEALDEGVLDRFARLDKGQVDSVLVGPSVEVFAGKLRAIIKHDARRAASRGDQPVQDTGDRAPQIEVSTSMAGGIPAAWRSASRAG